MLFTDVMTTLEEERRRLRLWQTKYGSEKGKSSTDCKFPDAGSLWAGEGEDSIREKKRSRGLVGQRSCVLEQRAAAPCLRVPAIKGGALQKHGPRWVMA